MREKERLTPSTRPFRTTVPPLPPYYLTIIYFWIFDLKYWDKTEISNKNIGTKQRDIKLKYWDKTERYQTKITYYFSVLVALSSCRICLSDNILPPLAKFWKGSIRHLRILARKRHGRNHRTHPVVPAEFYRTPSIRSQIAEYAGH